MKKHTILDRPQFEHVVPFRSSSSTDSVNARKQLDALLPSDVHRESRVSARSQNDLETLQTGEEIQHTSEERV